MTQNISELPRIRAMIRSDGTGDLLIDGVSQHITAADEAGVREEIINRVTDAARSIRRAVRLTAEDEQGQSPLIVHPNGDVEDDGAFIPTPVAPQQDAVEQAGDAEDAEAEAENAPQHSPRPAARISAMPGATPVSATATETEVVELVALVVAPKPETAEDQAPEDDAPDLDAAVLDAAVLDAAAVNAGNIEDAVADAGMLGDSEHATTFDDLVLDLDADADDDEDGAEQDVAAAGYFAPRSASDSDTATATAEPAPVPSPPLVDPAAALAVLVGSDSPAVISGEGPNLADFMNSRPPLVAGPALLGWQGAIRRLTGGMVAPAPGAGEMAHRAAVASVQRSLVGPRTIVVLNPKGGAHKTTATLLIAATFGIHRGGYTLAWDNNETMGTLGVRAQTAAHTNTAVDLLRDLDNFAYSSSARVGDLDNYVRNQGDARFDALASDLDPAGAASIDDVAFRKLHAALSRFYRVLIIDTGNNMRASNWEAAVETADQLVVVSTIREDTAYGAASLLDGLRQKGHADKVAHAVTILASPAKTADRQLSVRLHDHFSQLTRTVVDVPYDAALVAGGSLNIDALAPRTREAWLLATAAIAEGL
ncbi:MinD/ParA family ATP-binding protein [Cryobacterium cryoconiti]|uniref:Chromosome partitioning protein n=1 Tax=Cryobacterium cryoconiti TaxID=1259239 RepID=A0A4Y8JYP4_9MICO|nr:chromosome partitioning protein [Cryobacterium cryoconiti]TFD28246.1 chromosome partitioning protein [Cryobacterium cryoconiti]